MHGSSVVRRDDACRVGNKYRGSIMMFKYSVILCALIGQSQFYIFGGIIKGIIEEF